MTPAHSPARRALPAVIVLLALLALVVPARWQRWAQWVGVPVQHTIVPISGPMRRALSWLGVGHRPPRDDEAVRVLEEQKEELNSALLRAMLEIERLQAQIDSFRMLSTFDSGLTSRMIAARVSGMSSDHSSGAIRVEAGSREGVSLGTVGTAGGLQIIGQVTGVDRRLCTIRPITARGQSPIRAMVMIGEGLDGLICTLKPTGDGRLRGEVEDRRGAPGEAPVEPAVGQHVRLHDPGRWPAAAQMLLIGTVEAVEPVPEQPLRRAVVVRPTIPELDRVSEVLLLVPAEPATPEGE